jgi:hypothetical protein
MKTKDKQASKERWRDEKGGGEEPAMKTKDKQASKQGWRDEKGGGTEPVRKGKDKQASRERGKFELERSLDRMITEKLSTICTSNVLISSTLRIS